MDEPKYIKLSKFAKDLGVVKQTLYRWRREGKLDFVKIGKRMNGVTQETYNSFLGIQKKKEDKTVIYCRVSSSANKENLKTQVERVKGYCIARGYKIHKIVKEFGSGLNDNRKGLIKLLEDQEFTRIVVEHKDRLTRSGFNYIKALLEYNGVQVEVINEAEDNEEDIIQDFISIITSYCARIYGKRRSKRKTEKLIKELQE